MYKLWFRTQCAQSLLCYSALPWLPWFSNFSIWHGRIVGLPYDDTQVIWEVLPKWSVPDGGRGILLLSLLIQSNQPWAGTQLRHHHYNGSMEWAANPSSWIPELDLGNCEIVTRGGCCGKSKDITPVTAFSAVLQDWDSPHRNKQHASGCILVF